MSGCTMFCQVSVTARDHCAAGAAAAAAAAAARTNTRRIHNSVGTTDRE